MFRYGLLAALDGTDSIQTAVGEAENGSQLLEVVDVRRPYVVVTDLHMPRARRRRSEPRGRER
ncbi:MAG: hypothetical protein M3P93_14720 [Actinomycetota bacterium]|nr:hypothetical protein [Actinomycetota bacterium]